MSKYTTQVRWIVENATPDMEGQSLSLRIGNSVNKIFNFTYPFWNEEYKPILEKKILMHYINKEIGFETVGLWKLYLEERLNYIMPYYNKVYETTIKDYDYMWTINDQETYTGNKKAVEDATYTLTGNDTFHGTGSNTDAGTQKDLSSDLPQANYANLDYGTNLLEREQNTQSNITNDSTNDRTSNSTNKLNNTADETYARKRTGSTGVPLTDLLLKYRDSLINIDAMVIEELQDLFMTIY